MIKVVIPGKPQAQQRVKAYRRGKHASVYEPDASRNWKATAQQHFAEACKSPLPAPIAVDIVAVFPCPTSDYRKTKPQPRRWHTKANGDADNIAKAVLDAGNGVAWLDDREVTLLRVVKVIGAQGEAPCVIVDARHILDVERYPWRPVKDDDDNPRTAYSAPSNEALVVRGEPWPSRRLADL